MKKEITELEMARIKKSLTPTDYRLIKALKDLAANESIANKEKARRAEFLIRTYMSVLLSKDDRV